MPHPAGDAAPAGAPEPAVDDLPRGTRLFGTLVAAIAIGWFFLGAVRSLEDRLAPLVTRVPWVGERLADLLSEGDA